MADPKETIRIYHPEANPTEGVEVTREEYENLWHQVGWKLQPKSKENK